MKYLKKRTTVLFVSLLLTLCIASPAYAGWGQSSRIHSAYANTVEGDIGIRINGVPFGLGLEISEGLRYTVIYCGGFSIYCDDEESKVLDANGREVEQMEDGDID